MWSLFFGNTVYSKRNSEVKYIEDDNTKDSRNPIPRHEQSPQEKGYAARGAGRGPAMGHAG